MKITREQFIRGFNAIKASHDRCRVINEAARKAGQEDFEIGTDPAIYELRKLLEEWCGDIGEDARMGTDIDYALYEGGEVTPFKGAEPFIMDSAEAVWSFWMHSKTGPFRPEVLK